MAPSFARPSPPSPQRTSRLWAVVALVAVALVAGAPSWARRSAAPQDFESLRATLPADDDAAAAALERFARDDRPALRDRLLALSAWRRAAKDDDDKQIEVDLLEAHLRALGNAAGLRTKTLRRAAAAVRKALKRAEDELATLERAQDGAHKRKRAKRSARKRARERVAQIKALQAKRDRLAALRDHLDGVRAGDDALDKLRRAIRTRAREHNRKPADAGEAIHVAALTEAIPHYDALGDERQQAEAELALALFLEHSDAARADVDRVLKRLVRVGGRSRDLARVRQKVRRARARVLEEQGELTEAVHESLVADRAVRVPLHEAAFGAPPPVPYARSRTTAELCWRARARGIRCADLEEARSGELSFYDYSQERRPELDPERAQMVLAEYEPLLLACLSEAAKRGNAVSNTTVVLEWSIGLDGHVRSFSITPRRLRDSPLEACFKGAFDRFRYPRYKGEMQHTQMSYSVGG